TGYRGRVSCQTVSSVPVRWLSSSASRRWTSARRNHSVSALNDGAALLASKGIAVRRMTRSPSDPRRAASVVTVPIRELANVARIEQREVRGETRRDLSDLVGHREGGSAGHGRRDA